MDEIDGILKVEEESTVEVGEKVLPNYEDALYGIQGIMADHHITLEQAFYLLCKTYGLDYVIELSDSNSLYQKGLMKPGDKVNKTLLFHLKNAQQLTLDLACETKPNGNEYTLDVADRIEKQFTSDWLLKDEKRNEVAKKHFKGDLTAARYFLIFRSLFPVRSPRNNKKWNTKFGFVFNGVDLWDDSPRVAKKFHEVYRKLDIGVFLEATYIKIKNFTDFEAQKCFMTKPFKFLNAFDSVYEEAMDSIETRIKNKAASISSKETDSKNEIYV